jgi:hypothetical protein
MGGPVALGRFEVRTLHMHEQKSVGHDQRRNLEGEFMGKLESRRREVRKHIVVLPHVRLQQSDDPDVCKQFP